MHTPRKTHINHNITNKEFMPQTAEQLFTVVNTRFLQIKYESGSTCCISVLPRYQCVTEITGSIHSHY